VLELKKIIDDCKEGHRDAQQKLYEHFASRMFAVCLRYAKNRADAEDYLQEGFLKVFAKIHQFNHAGSFEGWMRRVIVTTILEDLRKKSKIHFVKEDEILDLTEDNPAEENDTPNTQPSLNEILSWIKKLPDRYQIVFNLYVLEDFSHNEIAKELGISVGTSKSNLSRARQWLQKHIKTQIPETDKKEAIWQI
jgi:RNA polymerase sigma-70 factor (ECF subfamily)